MTTKNPFDGKSCKYWIAQAEAGKAEKAAVAAEIRRRSTDESRGQIKMAVAKKDLANWSYTAKAAKVASKAAPAAAAPDLGALLGSLSKEEKIALVLKLLA